MNHAPAHQFLLNNHVNISWNNGRVVIRITSYNVCYTKLLRYYGRVIVKYHKTFQTQGIYYEKICDELIVNQILPATFDGYDFPGYDKVRLTYRQLKTIIHQNKKDWVAALENQKAVYLITDTNNGKLYVGSATSNYGMLLHRWSSYIANGHGGNSLMNLYPSEVLFSLQRTVLFRLEAKKLEAESLLLVLPDILAAHI